MLRAKESHGVGHSAPVRRIPVGVGEGGLHSVHQPRDSRQGPMTAFIKWRREARVWAAIAWYMRSVFTAGMPQMTASTHRRYSARSARSAALYLDSVFSVCVFICSSLLPRELTASPS